MDDLVAELTLQIRAEGNAALDQVRSEFGALDTTLQDLNGVLGELRDTLAGLQAPAGLVTGMEGMVDETDAAITAAQNLGVAIDDDAAKIQALKDAYAGGDWTMLGGAAPGAPGGAGGGAGDDQAAMDAYYAGATGGGANTPPRPPPDEPPPDPRPEPNGFVGGAGDVGTHLLMAGVEAGLARDAADKYAEFYSVLNQTAIKEGYSGAAAADEVQRLSGTLDSLALSTGNSSTDLAEAYYFLVTTGMNKQLIGQLMPSLAQDATAYNNPPLEDAQSVFTLNGVLDVPADQIGQGLSIISRAAQLGHFGVGDFGNYLPGLAAQLSILKDTGIGGEVQVASALEATRRVSGSSEQDAIDMEDLINYLASPMAARFFDRTKRSQDLLGAPILDLFKKYHIDGINIPQYLDSREAKGEGSFDAMMDLARLIETDLPANVSGTDEREIFGALFHNQQAAMAALGIAQNYGDFKTDESDLYGVSPTTVGRDFSTAFNAPPAQVAVVNEKFAELTRELGQDVIPTLGLLGTAAHVFLTGLNEIGNWYQQYFANPVGGVIGTAAAYAAQGLEVPPAGTFQPRAEPRVHLEITAPPGMTLTPKNVPPGTSVRVNQGPVLGVH